jgi:AbrB family looped-hinge helix DNA binding protein
VKATVDSAGRVVIPEPLRDALVLAPGATVDITLYRSGLHLAPHGRTARLVEQDGLLVVTGGTEIDDEVVQALIDAGRR